MVDKGTIKPKPEVIAGMKRLVSALIEMQPETRIYIEAPSGKCFFKVVATGELIAELNFSDDLMSP
jgi:hypothetical protein